MARVLVTALGTGRLISKSHDPADARPSRKYDSATYVIKDGESSAEYTTTFIAEALIKHFAIERVYVVGTAKSMWEELYDTFSGDDRDDDYYLELGRMIDDSRYDHYPYDRGYLKKVEAALDKKLGCVGSGCYLIQYGLDREELLSNFTILMQIGEQLQPGDELYVDITHSFRSLSIFQYMMTSFIENLSDRDIKIAKILYGMLDIVREMGGKAPVVDLTLINELNHWIKGIYELEQYGNGYLVADLLKEQKSELAASIEDLSDRINMNFLKDIRNEHRRKLWKGLKNVDGPDSVAVSAIERSLKKFNNDQPEAYFQLNLTLWFFEQKRYAAGYITLTEAIITKLCEGKIININSWKERQKIVKAFINKEYDDSYGLVELYKKVNQIRRLVAHSQGGSEDQYRSAVANCIKYCDQAKRAFQQMDG
ncbi:TIGR02221 family CRISPR-associated protein [Pelotomaculum terephthalicicum JT]|uniref:TIGR02221 family CRISPR-associated protein n=1 Tax=Pelotomaculum TaxID=191373 RepID=UPI0009D269FF|nr:MULTISPECIES: TIGR02221 family CRISPR-associated protein [Pelotomaculum]MCG9968430.1 TIGR02221 family CRISPR-associated protein [Pelotomaculum terephthalicicum JT]OPX87182.1 MAG: CRISPR-associated (Cas) DxTHG family protein [Pelotomaculum sp. PtaB.Bin117]OPY60878.1 MAG: CRISPR-associated (Cas) DxTHG family protein [Pelotomaculum sp. PtaU1.Bin065]